MVWRWVLLHRVFSRQESGSLEHVAEEKLAPTSPFSYLERTGNSMWREMIFQPSRREEVFAIHVWGVAIYCNINHQESTAIYRVSG